MSRPARDVSELSPEQRARLEERLRSRLPRPTSAGIPRRGRQDDVPLSFAQQRLWFLERLEPESAAYNVIGAFRIAGRLDVDALERALGEIVRRHEALRTRYEEVGGRPVQQVAPAVAVPLEATVLPLPESEREEAVRRAAEREVARPFDLAQGGLLRATLLRFDTESHALLLCLHHIASDGWSVGVLLRELDTLYAAFSEGRPSPLPELPVQYGDFAAWQRDWLQGDALRDQLSYWRERLSGRPAALELPTDRPRPPVQGFRGARRDLALPARLTDALRELAQREGTTLFVVLLAAFQALLGRHSGQTDLVVGSPVANRTRSEVEGLVGFFVNMLALRVDLSGDPSFRELLGRVHEVVLGAQAHQDVPFERLVEELESGRDLSRNPVFQVAFAFQNTPRGRLALGDLAVLAVPIDTGTVRFDLECLVGESDTGLSVAIRYSTDLFEGSRVDRMLGHYESLLSSVARDAGERVSGLGILGESERRRVLLEWNETGRERGSDRLVQERFSLEASRRPSALAVVDGLREWSYGELEKRSNQLGRYLRGKGVGPEVRVGLCVGRGVDLVLGALGVMKAGGAYVALDPELPAERLEWMLRDSGSRVVVTQEVLVPKVSGGVWDVVRLDGEWERIGLEEGGVVSSGVEAGNLAYVIYTSGSTGMPKGVELTHAGLRNLVEWHCAAYGLGEVDRGTQVSGLGFDASVWEVWPYLSSGGSVHLVGEEDRGDPARVKQWLLREGITVSFLPTPLAEAVLSEEWGERGRLRVLLTGGDRLRKRPRAGLGFAVVNHYGPTEATVVSTAGEVETEGGPPLIGSPIANVRGYVLDGRLMPVAEGVWGELYVGGEGVGRGYVGRGDLTAECFLPDPFVGESGSRMYRSGDVVRWVRGSLEFGGRRDQQVKVRGYRIELGEIETVLTGHVGVKQGVVVVREEGEGDKRLVGYVVWKDGMKFGVEELREHLRGKLPGYMVPSAIVELEELPLTSSGKVDRRGLPAPGERGTGVSEEAPQDAVEEILAGIFGEVLGLEIVGVEESFFDLGGHSLLATKVVSRVREALGVELGLREVFETPTVRALGAAVGRARARGGSRVCGIERVSREGDLALSFAQQRMWLLEQLEGGRGLYNVGAGLRLKGDLDVGALERSLGEIVRRHEALRTRFERVEGRVVQRVDAAVLWRLEVEDLTGLAEEDREREARRVSSEESRRAFDLERGPLVRGRLLRVGEDEHVFVLVMHHLVSDGWSIGILVKELKALYAGYREGREAKLPELAVQYADYASWQRQWLRGEELESQLGYWKERLSGAPRLLELPTDHPRPAVQGHRGARRELSLPVELAEGLKQLSRREGATLFMVLLAAFDVVLRRHSGQSDVVVGSPIAGRTRKELEGLIGFFVNTLVLRTDVSGDPTFRELVGRVREVALGAYAHQDLPFEKLVEELNPERATSHHPLFQVAFALQNIPRETLQLAGLEISVPRSEEDLVAKFDLTVMVTESAEGLGVSASYDADLFLGTTVERLLGHYARCLEGAVARPEARVSELALLDEGERRQLVEGWNATGSEYPREACVHELFSGQARLRPEAVAVVFGEERLSYWELEVRSNRLARYLMRLGVGVGTRVGLCVERSTGLVVSTLAILKAGGAYLPLDPSYPSERLAFMLRDGEVGVVVTQEALRERLPEQAGTVVCLEEERGAIDLESDAPVVSGAVSEDLAYVIYTSGSTGEPKGVCVSHRAVSRLVLNTNYVELGAGDVVAQASNASFDAATFELWGALLNGGRVEGLSREVTLQPREFAAELRERGVKVLFLTTALFNLLARDAPGAFEGLETLLFGGEAVDPRWVRAVVGDRGPRRLLHVYGPTETTTFATWHLVEGVPEEASSVPIGLPISNTTAYVLDGRMEPVPHGVAGELYLGGEGLARGYWRRPELTAERFVPDPFGEAGGRLYRTGDLVKRGAGGAIEFLGRVDHQVKLRGFRVELGEIESALREDAEVREAAVLLREDGAAGRRLVAYVVRAAGGRGGWDALREHLRRRLPDYMVPAAFVALESLPLTPNGKLDRHALPAPAGGAADHAGEHAAPSSEMERAVAAVWQDVLGVAQVGVEDSFFDLGGHSLLLVQVHERLRERFPDANLRIVDLFRCPTVRTLAEHLAGRVEPSGLERVRARARRRPDKHREPIAIVGAAGRFPRARDVEELWQNLRSGVEAVTFFTDDELRASGVGDELLGDPSYVKARAILDGVDLFDASFFSYTPREAEAMDPQQRVFLETAWGALEDAGYGGGSDGRPVGVYAGASISTYLYNNLQRSPETLAAVGGLQVKVGNDKDSLATRVSYQLGLRGPSISVQTACSTSLVAVHLACAGLLTHECDMALAGGVSITFPQRIGYRYMEEGILSPDGHCRAFDARARGTVSGSGVGIVVLKRLADALADGDTIRAVILGSAVNNDGSLKVGYTAPSVQGQAEVIAAAQAQAGVEPDSISYVEAHGTGTALGDPVEIEALTQAFRARTPRSAFCALGSMKSNIGHLDAAAGVAGLIKTMLALERRELPPSLHFESPNPKIDFASTPFRVNSRLLPWESEGPRRAGVSSFGIGGTNAHVVLEEAPPSDPGRPALEWQLLVLSAKTEPALERAVENLRAHLRSKPDAALADIAYTLKVGRRAFRHRRAVLCRGVEEAESALARADSSLALGGTVDDGGRPVVFAFPGQGSQRVGMGGDFYRRGGVFREEMDRCSELLSPELGLDLRALLYPAAGGEAEAERRLQETWLTQPAVFAVDWSLARQWQAWGVEPRGLIGHSVGEYVAACVSGVMSVEDGLRLVARRGRLMQRLPRGAMLAVPLPEAEVRSLLGDELSLAAVNAPSQCVVSGPDAAVADVEERLRDRGVGSRRLATSHAFHSRMTEPILAELEECLRGVRLSAPRIPYVSNLTGTWATAAEAADPGYWSRHLRGAVRFSDGVGELLKAGPAVLLEVGPGRTLSPLAKQHPSWGREHVALASTRPENGSVEESDPVQRVLAQLWVSGAALDWERVHAGEGRRRRPLPTYPFERTRYFVDPPAGEARPAHAPALTKSADVDRWFYAPIWKSAPPLLGEQPGRAAEPGQAWLVLAGEAGPGVQLAAKLRDEGHEVVVVRPGSRFERRNAEYTIRPGEPEDYRALVSELAAHDLRPRVVVHGWSAGLPNGGAPVPERFETASLLGFDSARFLVQALARRVEGAPLRLVLLASHLHEVTGGETTCPERLPLLGVCRVAPQEQPGLTCLSVDAPLSATGLLDGGTLDLVIRECLGGEAGATTALRGGRRWLRAFEPLALPPASRERPALRDRGTYLVTGGLGEIGLEVAGLLARAARARLVLVGRTSLPARQEWDGWLRSRGDADPTSRRILKLRALESMGAEVLAVAADVADPERMRAVVAEAEARFGPIQGVVHAAGVTRGASFGSIAELAPGAREEQFRPKVLGLQVLHDVLVGRELDFCLLMSSLSTVLGGVGMAAYVGANLFMEGFALGRHQAGDTAWTSVSWDGWWLGDVAARRPAEGSLAALAMSRREGTAALERLLAVRGLPQIVVSTADLGARRAQWVERANAAPQGTTPAAAGARHPRPPLVGAYVAPRNAVERTIAEIWGTLLGIRDVGVFDDFLELGGHSLLATQVTTRLRETFGVEVPLRDLFEAATVAGLAERIAASEGKPGRAARVAEMVQRLKSLSPEERSALLQRERELRDHA